MENGSGCRASTSASMSSGFRPCAGFLVSAPGSLRLFMVSSIRIVLVCFEHGARAGRGRLARVAKQAARERREAAQRKTDPRRPVRRFVADLVGGFLDQEEIEQG